MPFKDPLQFWENNNIVKTIDTGKLFRNKYQLPDIKDAKGQPIFENILIHICKTCTDSLQEKGFILLDREWAENPAYAKYREMLFKQYPEPFMGRRAYAMKLAIQEFEVEYQDEKKQMVKRKEIHICTKMKNSFMLPMYVAIYKNKELGYNPITTNTKTIDPNTGAFIEIPSSNPEEIEKTKYKRLNSFISEQLATKIEGFIGEMYDKNYPLPQEFFAFAIGGDIRITTSEKVTDNNGQKATKTYTNVNIDVDDVI